MIRIFIPRLSIQSDKWAAFRPDMIGSVAIGTKTVAGPWSCTSPPKSRGARR